jgi:hypothetical protein
MIGPPPKPWEMWDNKKKTMFKPLNIKETR